MLIRNNLNDEVIDLPVLFLGVFLHRLLQSDLDFAENVLDLPRPPDLISGKADHTLIPHHPLHSTAKHFKRAVVNALQTSHSSLSMFADIATQYYFCYIF